MVTILIMSGRKATLGLLKRKVFWNKRYDVIISVHDDTNKLLSHDSNCIVDVAMWPKLERSYHNLNFIKIWPEEPLFWGVVLVQVQ